MITPEQFAELVARYESDRIEFTVSTTNMDKFSEAVCAFSNDLADTKQNGFLFVGVDDKGVPAGLKVTDELMRNLASIRCEGNVLPSPAMTVQKLVLPEGEVAVVEVKPSQFTPVRYKGKIWVRIGPRKAVANESEERILIEKRIAQAYTFDALPCTDATISDLDVDTFEWKHLKKAVDADLLQNDRRSIEEKLASLRLYDLRYKCPTFAAIILFGKSVERFLPGAYVQYVKFSGEDVTSEVLAQYKYSGGLYEILPKIDTFVDTTISVTRPVPVSALREENYCNYPHWAIRELLMNAIMHRDYQSNAPVRLYEFSNHLEITNPGFLFGESRPENFPAINDYRNPVVAEAMKVMGYVNKFSYGVRRVREELVGNGNGEPRFNFTLLTAFQVDVDLVGSNDGYTQETHKKHTRNAQETHMEERILEFCSIFRSVSEILQNVGLSDGRHLKRKYIKPMIENGQLEMLYPDSPTHRSQMYRAKEVGRISQLRNEK